MILFILEIQIEIRAEAELFLLRDDQFRRNGGGPGVRRAARLTKIQSRHRAAAQLGFGQIKKKRECEETARALTGGVGFGFRLEFVPACNWNEQIIDASNEISVNRKMVLLCMSASLNEFVFSLASKRFQSNGYLANRPSIGRSTIRKKIIPMTQFSHFFSG